MAFPTKGILDSFDRADESPAAGWSDGPDGGTYGNVKIASNLLATITTDAYSYYNVATYGPDLECYVTVPTLFTSNAGFELDFRYGPVGSGADGYVVQVTPSTSLMRIQRIDNAVATTLGATISQAFAAGDSFGAEVIGSTITAYYKSGAGAWSAVGSRTDATYNQAGRINVYMPNTGGRFNDLGGGTLSAAATPKRSRRLAPRSSLATTGSFN